MGSETEDGSSDKEDTAESDSDEGQIPETFSQHEITSTKFQATVRVRQLRSRGLSFQLWQTATALSQYLRREFEADGMCIRSRATENQHLCVPWTNPECSVEGFLAKIGQTNLSERSAPWLPEVEESDRPLRRSEADNGLSKRRMRVLELGAGTGLVGLVAACLGANVVLTDLDHVIPNLAYNLELNKDIIQNAEGCVEAKVLRWGIEEDVRALGELPFDLILASDCVYDDTAYKPFLQTLKWLMAGDRGGARSRGSKSRNPNGMLNIPSAPVDPAVSSLLPRDCSEHVADCLALSRVDPPSQDKDEKTPSKIEIGEKIVSNFALATSNPTTGRGSPLRQPVIFLGHMRRWKKDSRFFRMASKCFEVEVVHRHAPEGNARNGPIVYRLSTRSGPKTLSRSSSSSHGSSSDCSSLRY